MTRVLLCDDNAAAPYAVQAMSDFQVSEGGEKIVVSQHVTTARAAMTKLQTFAGEVILIDLYLPVSGGGSDAPASGAWLARAILSYYESAERKPPVLVLWTSNIESLLEARNECRAFIHHGGCQVIDKQRHEPAQQVHALNAALAGRCWTPPDDGLTPSERKMFAYYAAGWRESEIAKRLYLDERTIQGHARNVRRKLLPGASAGHGRGAAPVIKAAAAPSSRISWLPIEHLGEPPSPFDRIEG